MSTVLKSQADSVLGAQHFVPAFHLCHLCSLTVLKRPAAPSGSSRHLLFYLYRAQTLNVSQSDSALDLQLIYKYDLHNDSHVLQTLFHFQDGTLKLPVNSFAADSPDSLGPIADLQVPRQFKKSQG